VEASSEEIPSEATPKRPIRSAPRKRVRPERLVESMRRLEEEHQVQCQANADYEAYRAARVIALVR